MAENSGLTFERVFTTEGVHPYDEINWVTRDAVITGSDGSIVFEQKDVEAPDFWSDSAVNIVASRYFRGSLNTSERETSVRQLINRVINMIVGWGHVGGYYDGENANIFANELRAILSRQYACFNTPSLLNLGWSGRPQSTSACYLCSVQDSMESILSLFVTEGTIYKSGGGSGTNLSTLRSSKESLAAGGHSSGVISFMRALDLLAGTIKSGGSARRAAVMRMLNADHPEIYAFVQTKVLGERVAHALIDAGFDGQFNVENGAYSWAPYQNCNHSVRVTNDFMMAVSQNREWELRAVTTGKVLETVNAKDLFRSIAEAAWECGDPGLIFDTTVNDWNTVPNTGRINTTNPCQPSFATVLTPDGIRTFADIDVGSTIWSGTKWTRVKRKIHTGTKEVLRYRTTAGVFDGTKDHRVFQDAERVPVELAETIDICSGSEFESNVYFNDLDSVDITDGWLIGDGTVHIASSNLVLIEIGANDDDVHSLGTIGRKRDGVGPFSWEVGKSSVTYTELPRTYDRKIPDRFLYGTPGKVAGFLRGIYSANGSICGGRVTLKATSIDIISGVQMMLSSLGIRSYFTTNKPVEVEFSNGKYLCKQSYDLNITADKLIFRDKIGFVQDYKQDRLNSACESVGKRRKHTYEIISVEPLGIMPVWDIEVESPDHSYWTGCLLVSNCAEVNFLDDVSCNLASINLLKFIKEDGSFDIDKFCHVCRVVITAMEICVGASEYPTEKIAAVTRASRPLGLGYSGLGEALMSLGLPYDSHEGRTFAAAITALLSGTAYAQSARIARTLGPFSEFDKNKSEMLAVIRRHRDSGYRVDTNILPNYLLRAIDREWTAAINIGEGFGFRNGQISVLAPCGTISFFMDSGTTGIEPEISLVKYKKLTGGGTIKTTSRVLRRSLITLGYDEHDIGEIISYIEDTGTIEGAPYIKDEHLPIFDCAFKPENGSRFIDPMGHVRMVSAVQPFLSGSASKTINVPESASIEDIENVYMQAWKMGIKTISVYRNNCKRSQPLSTKSDTTSTIIEVLEVPQSSHRHRLPDTRSSITHKFDISGHKGYCTVGLYDDGQPGEIFISMAKEGSTLSGLIDCFATSISINLQCGVPLKTLVDKFSHYRFEPSGFTKSKDIPMAKSIVDYIFRWLALRFLSKEDAVSVGIAQYPQLDEAEADAKSNHLYVADHFDTASAYQSDSPVCSNCGSIMTRSGSCHTCSACGFNSGCA